MEIFKKILKWFFICLAVIVLVAIVGAVFVLKSLDMESDDGSSEAVIDVIDEQIREEYQSEETGDIEISSDEVSAAAQIIDVLSSDTADSIEENYGIDVEAIADGDLSSLEQYVEIDEDGNVVID